MGPQAAVTFTESVTPYLPLIGTVIGGMVIGFFAVWNRRRGAVETRAPDVNDIWLQQAKDNQLLDDERAFRRFLEDIVYDLLKLFKGYVNRVRRGGSTDLTTRELQYYQTSFNDLVAKEKDKEKSS